MVQHIDTLVPASRGAGMGPPGDTGGRGRTGSTGRSGTPGNPARDTGSASLPPLDPALEANYIVFDTARKTATFQLTAGDEIPAQVSFNGVRRGGRTLTIPLGWRVTVMFANRDPELPHSATIVAVAGPIPEQLPEPAFSGAQTVKVEEGLLEGDADEIRFLADHAGRYLLACGVLGHAQRGQWITLDISATAVIPRYR